MSTESLNCPNCGAPLINAGSATTVVCDHCGSVVALKLAAAPPPSPPPTAPDTSREIDPRYEYGAPPAERPARSDLTSLALGPADASQVIQLLRDNQEQAAIQLYQARTGVSLDDAIDAVRAIRDGLRDAPPPGQLPPAPVVSDGPFYMPEVRRQLELGDKNAAIAAYQAASGRSYAQARAEVDRLELQLYPVRKPAAQSRSSGWCGCSAIGLGIVALFMCVFGGCGTYLQTKSVFQCSLHQAEAILAKQQVLTPPVGGGYLVLVGGFNESSSLTSSSLTADFWTPVWGGNGWGMLRGHISQSGGSRGRVTATLYKDGKTIPVLAGATVDCGQ